MRYRLFNLAGFQAGWFACVLGAAAGRPLLGPVVVAVLAAVHLAVAGARREAPLLAAAGLLGYVADSGLVLAGLLRFDNAAAVGWPSTVWMVALWINFATTLHGSLAWLSGRYGFGAALGFLGGPLAYAAGARLGASSFGGRPGVSLAAIAVEWAVALPLLLRIAGRR